MEQIRDSGEQPWKLNNTALKWLRDQNEREGNPTVQELDLTSQGEIMIQTLVEPGGQDYSFTEPLQAWSWLKMLNGFNEENLIKAVGGTGVRRFYIAPLQGS